MKVVPVDTVDAEDGLNGTLLSNNGDGGAGFPLKFVAVGDGVGSYIGGGTKLAFKPWPCVPRPPLPPDVSPASIAACKSDAYRSWNVRL
jgi:hypothetical protein